MSDCPSEEQLAGFAARQCADAEARVIAEHTARCDRCRKLVASLRDNVAWADRVVGSAREGLLEAETDGDSAAAAACIHRADTLGAPVAGATTAEDSGPARIEQLIARGVLEQSPDPQYSARLGALLITGYIGRGGMGVVLKAHEEQLNRTVAVKILRPELADDETAISRFAREAKCAGGLNHPNIVTVHAVGHERDVHFLAMEYVNGPSLADVIRAQHALPADRIRQIFRQMLSGLACAHQAGLIHRDIKSSNILLEQATDHVKIADFGLARMVSTQTRLTLDDSTLGTPEYMSPEQARGDETIDHRTDLYSAGVVLYEMLTGETPFRGDRPSGVIYRILHEQPAAPRSVSPAAHPRLADFALRLMAKRPDDRFDAAESALAALDADERLHLPARRRMRQRRAIAAFCMLVVAVGCVWLFSRLEYRRLGAITWVGVDRDDDATRTAVLVSYGNDPARRRFHDFGPEAEFVCDAQCIDLDGSGQLAVVAGIAEPIDGYCLFAFDAHGGELWRLDLSWDWEWPDCAAATKFRCFGMASGDLDGASGDELAVIACDMREYATRISIVDPRSSKLVRTFWHMGHISGLFVQEDYFGKGRPAIVAWGTNNKLDGFDDRLPSDEPARTTHNLVTVVMILDPMRMDGLGPPRTERVPLPAAIPHAYAFLNSPYAPCARAIATPADSAPETSGGAVLADTAGVEAVRHTQRTIDGYPGPLFEIELISGRADETREPRGFLIVDRDLRLIDAVPVIGQRVARTPEYWRRYWRPIIREGQYITGE